MSLIESLLQIVLAYCLLIALGLGLTLSCLPAKFRSYSLFIAPSIGYVAFCFFTIWASGITHAPLLKGNWWALWGLVGWSAIILVRSRKELPEILRAAKWLPAIIGVMLLLIFFPVLHQGLDLYVGTANPDFYQSLSFHKTLIKYQAEFWEKSSNLPLSGPFPGMFPDAFQARFGAVAFSVLLEQMTGIPSHVAVMSSVIVYMFCLPPAVYFFCGVVLEFDKRAAILATFLIAIAAPTTMSFLHTFVGQNSALATIPLGISLIYLALRERSLALALLATLVLNGIFWIYVMALPYVLAPFVLYGVIKFIKQGGPGIRWWSVGIGAFVASSAIVHFSVFAETMRFLKDLLGLMGNVGFSPYYTEYLTEEIFQYALGLTSYPLSQSVLSQEFAPFLPKIILAFGISALTLLGILLTGLYFLAVRLWSRTVSQDAVLITLSLFIIYAAVWFYYTFVVRYGYAPFKMSVWLQFLIPPFFGWLILRNLDVIRMEGPFVRKLRSYVIFALLGPIYIGLNLVSTLDYGFKSYGRDIFHGSLINAYGIAGNNDFADLPITLNTLIPTGSTVALGFSDSIQNIWASFYVDHSGNKATILSHEVIPFEDAYLPEMHSRRYKDSLGNIQIDEQKYFNHGLADYYLLAGEKNLNRDIVAPNSLGKPLWSNDTFVLYEKSNISDLLTLGRGFYRIEHMDTRDKDWWWPATFRWSAEGGEIYHLMPSFPGKAYQIEFSAIAGLGVSSGQRTIGLWLNDTKFDEVVVNGAARIVSKPYFPTAGVNRLVLRVKEKSVLTPRQIGLWNRDLPRRSTPINILFSDIRIVNNSQRLPELFPVGKTVSAKELFEKVETFNGFDIDGWVREWGEFSTRISLTAEKAAFSLLIPGNLGFEFPYKVKFVINDVSFEKYFNSPGEYTVELDLPKRPSEATMKIMIIPQVAKKIAEGMEQREVLQSIRLSAVKFSTK